MAEFEYKDVKYRTGRLNLLTEAKLAKRLLPIISSIKSLSSAWEQASKISSLDKEEQSAEDKAAVAAAVSEALKNRDSLWVEFAEALGRLPDDDLTFIINECMSIAEREDDQGRWFHIWNTEAQRPMFKDITLPVVFAVVGAVLQSEFRDFFV